MRMKTLNNQVGQRERDNTKTQLLFQLEIAESTFEQATKWLQFNPNI